jgi:hypothetical protein
VVLIDYIRGETEGISSTDALCYPIRVSTFRLYGSGFHARASGGGASLPRTTRAEKLLR